MGASERFDVVVVRIHDRANIRQLAEDLSQVSGIAETRVELALNHGEFIVHRDFLYEDARRAAEGLKTFGLDLEVRRSEVSREFVIEREGAGLVDDIDPEEDWLAGVPQTPASPPERIAPPLDASRPQGRVGNADRPFEASRRRRPTEPIKPRRPDAIAEPRPPKFSSVFGKKPPVAFESRGRGVKERVRGDLSREPEAIETRFDVGAPEPVVSVDGSNDSVQIKLGSGPSPVAEPAPPRDPAGPSPRGGYDAVIESDPEPDPLERPKTVIDHATPIVGPPPVQPASMGPHTPNPDDWAGERPTTKGGAVDRFVPRPPSLVGEPEPREPPRTPPTSSSLGEPDPLDLDAAVPRRNLPPPSTFPSGAAESLPVGAVASEPPHLSQPPVDDEVGPLSDPLTAGLFGAAAGCLLGIVIGLFAAKQAQTDVDVLESKLAQAYLDPLEVEEGTLPAPKTLEAELRSVHRWTQVRFIVAMLVAAAIVGGGLGWNAMRLRDLDDV